MPRTKIICTIGPSSKSPETIKALMKHGMNVARLNFSHGSRREHGERIRLIREISEELSYPVGILQDLAGPKIRVGPIPDPGVRLETGQTFVLTGQQIQGGPDRVSVTYANLPNEVEKGDRILLADGAIELAVRIVIKSEILCKVITGGLLTSHKGLNLPTRTIRTPSFTEADRDDLIFGIDRGVDYVALSFVRSAKEILEAKELIRKKGADIPVIAKIEQHEALERIEDILEAAEGIMVARGDLGVEIPLEDVPVIQKELISRANELGKPVITATQMLRSMINSPRPTRAEAADVANAVLDGTDAVMLSEETASGEFPEQSLQFMSHIIDSSEKRYLHERYLQRTPSKEVAESVAHAACILAKHLEASAIVAPTHSGQTARYISIFRPMQPIIALSPNKKVVQRLTLVWGCRPQLVDSPASTDDMIESSARSALKTGIVKRDDLVVITAGHPVGAVGSTNMVRVKKL
jgi:pyruvate kinase